VTASGADVAGGRHDRRHAGARNAAVLAALTVLAGAARAQEGHTARLETRSWEELSNRRVSVAGERALKAAGAAWTHAESPQFIYHALSAANLEPAARFAEFGYRELSRHTGPEINSWDLWSQITGRDRGRKPHLFLIPGGPLWDQVLAGVSSRPDGVAMQLANEVFAPPPGDDPASAMKLAHELVHLRLWRIAGERVPIWLDEGLAGYASWQVTRAYFGKQGRVMTRAAQTVTKERLMSLQQLTAVKEYPKDPAAARAFYRQCEEFIRSVASRIGQDRLASFVLAVASGTTRWDEFFRKRYGFSEEDFRRLEQDMRLRCQTAMDL